MQRGVVKWFDNKKGYGFIVYNEEDEILIHLTAMKGNRFKSLDENQSVEFKVMEGNRGPQAVHVKKIDN